MRKKKTKFPRGWNENRVRRVVEYYENQTEEDAAAEIESAAASDTIMQIPRELVPTVRSLIAKHQRGTARRRILPARA